VLALVELRDCLNAQGRKYEAEQIDKQFRAAWKVAEVGSVNRRNR
jgi:hypothetical protein